ncbi:MAG: phage holin family protein [Rhodothermaceae bacterium]|nr:phage holin family protein [Rhodothermaceae bacterium]
MKEQDETTKDLLKKIPADLKQLLDKKIEIIQLQLTERAALLAGRLLFKVIGAAMLFLGMILMLWAGGFLLGQLLDNQSAGFAILALFMIMIGAVLIKFHTRGMIRSVKNKIIRAVLEAEEDDSKPDNEIRKSD